MGVRKLIIAVTNVVLDRLNVNLEIIETHPKEAIKYAKNHFQGKEIIAAEIGVFFGKNALEINKNLNVNKLYLIDPYLKYDNFKNDSACRRLKDAKKAAHKRNTFNNIIWVEEYSTDAINTINEELDFLYIDGNHNYEYIKTDLNTYWPLIKKGGIISGHDIQGTGVSKALLEFAKNTNVDVFFGDRRDWWIIK